MYNILVCDDEKDIVEALGIYLSAFRKKQRRWITKKQSNR